MFGACDGKAVNNWADLYSIYQTLIKASQEFHKLINSDEGKIYHQLLLSFPLKCIKGPYYRSQQRGLQEQGWGAAVLVRERTSTYTDAADLAKVCKCNMLRFDWQFYFIIAVTEGRYRFSVKCKKLTATAKLTKLTCASILIIYLHYYKKLY